MTLTERLLGALLVAVAAWLRFRDLAHEPLGILEAASTWPAWAAATAGPATPPLPGAPPPASALLFGGQWALFWLTGSGTDLLARAWPAALGTAVVLVPWLMRPVIGAGATLALAGLLAVDPALVGTSRLADGASASALAALLVVACVVRWRGATGSDAAGDRARQCWLQATAVSLGLLVASGPGAWSFLLLLGLAGAGAWPDAAATPAGARRLGERGRVGGVLGVGAASAVLAATAGLVQRRALPAVGTSLAAWGAPWLDTPGLPGLLSLLERLVLEQPLTLALGALGLLTEWRRTGPTPRRRRDALLAICGLALALAWAERATIVGRLPLTLLLALVAARTVGRLPGTVALRTGGARLAGLCAAVLLLFTLRHAFQPPTREEATQAGVRLLAADAASLCAWQVGDARECPVRVVGNPRGDPLLAWYLRDLERLRWVPSPLSDLVGPAAAPLIVTPDVSPPWQRIALDVPLPAGYAGSRYRIRIGASGPVGVILWVPPEESGPARVSRPASEPAPEP